MAKEIKITEELQHLSLRSDFKVLQLSNANHFGNLAIEREKQIKGGSDSVFVTQNNSKNPEK